jgi:signal transduction histidine kinase
MKHLTLRSSLYLAIDVALVVVCVLHVPSLRELATAPFVLEEAGARVVVAEVLQPASCPELQPGDELLSWSGHRMTMPAVVGFLAHHSSIGEEIPITYRRSGQVLTGSIRLIPENHIGYIILVCLVGIITWCLGVFVLLMRQRDLAASVLHWAMMSMAVVVVIAFDEVTPHSKLGYLSSLLFFASYAGVATTFFFFTTVFPRRKQGPTWLKLLVTYAPAMSLLVPIIYHHSRAVALMSVDEFISFRSWFDVFHISLFVYIGGGILNFIHSYATSPSMVERKQLKWILWGLCIGPAPFLLLTILPGFVAQEYMVPEEYTLAFLVVIPIAFAISCIKYHALDVEVVISRTTAYAIAIGILGAVYILVVGAVASVVGNVTASAGAAVVVALLFEPVRLRVQHVVDRRFFRVRYNFREAQRTVFEEIKYCLDIRQLAEVVVRRIDEVIPLARLGFFILRQPGNRIHLVSHKGFEILEKHGVVLDAAQLKTHLQLPVAVDSRIEAGVQHESADVETFRRWGMVLVFSMLSEKSEFLGFLVLGEKKSGARFVGEDVDLLSNIATQAGLAIERVALQQQLVLKQAETERLEDLNRLKSDFVSYVSHELKTPLTSIKMFAELLQARSKKTGGKAQEYLHIIEGETDRLDRMVTTILDSARIEQGVKEYQFGKVDLSEVAKRVMGMMTYQLDKQGFHVVFRPGKRSLILYADADAVAQAMINLISNAIKYSLQKKYLKLVLGHKGDWISCSLQDRGAGISPEALLHLFERFYRDPRQSRHVQGVGLGLPLVKHIMEAHGGSVEARSELGKGSTFTLLFPITKMNHEQEKENSGR